MTVQIPKPFSRQHQCRKMAEEGTVALKDLRGDDRQKVAGWALYGVNTLNRRILLSPPLEMVPDQRCKFCNRRLP